MVSAQTILICGVVGAMLSNGSLTFESLIYLCIGLAALFVAFLYSCQEQMLYQPKVFPQFVSPRQNPPGLRSPAEHQIPFEDVSFLASDGIMLTAWFLRPESLTERKQRPTILFFHANAGNMGFRLENLKMMFFTLKCNVLILSYRGYGDSQGVPSESGLCLDADAAYNYLVTCRPDIDSSRLVVFGRSLGGSVAIYLANKFANSSIDVSQRKIKGIVLENTFLSIADMADSLFPFLRLPLVKKYLLKLKWEAGARIRVVGCPILFISGLCDEVVPSIQMKRLFEAATQTEYKTMLTVEKGQHNNTWTEGGISYITAFQDFINKFALPIEMEGESQREGEGETSSSSSSSNDSTSKSNSALSESTEKDTDSVD